MSSHCFTTEEATQNILESVTSVCAECYSDISLGDEIHYDMQHYRYLCNFCQESLSAQMNENCELMEEENNSLFC